MTAYTRAYTREPLTQVDTESWPLGEIVERLSSDGCVLRHAHILGELDGREVLRTGEPSGDA